MVTVTQQPGPDTARLRAALAALKGVSTQVGWFASAKYPEGTPVAYVATIQEYGYAPKHIAPRMGLRGMIAEKQSKWAAFAQRVAKAVITGSMEPLAAMDVIGAAAEADIRRQIASVKEPMLAERTLQARARALGLDDVSDLTGTGSKPLVEPARKKGGAGLLIASVSHIVSSGGAVVQ